MLSEMGHQIFPPLHAFWWRDILFVPEGVKRIRVECQLLRHKADLDKRPHAVFQEAVINLIDISEVVYGISMFVFVVDTKFVMKNCMEANVTEVSHLLHSTQIIPVAF